MCRRDFLDDHIRSARRALCRDPSGRTLGLAIVLWLALDNGECAFRTEYVSE
jgi:hypothetical protein